MLPKKGKKLHLDEEDMAFAMMIAEALDTDLGRTHQGVKTAMSWTGASERSSMVRWIACAARTTPGSADAQFQPGADPDPGRGGAARCVARP